MIFAQLLKSAQQMLLFEEPSAAPKKPERPSATAPAPAPAPAQPRLAKPFQAQSPEPAPLSLADAIVPTVFVHPQANRQIRLQGTSVSYVLKRGKRRTIGFAVGPDGLAVSAPRWTGVGEIESAVQEKSDWILSKLGLARERAQRMVEQRIVWQNGCVLPFLGENITVELDATQTRSRASAGLAQLREASDGGGELGQRVLTLGLPQTASADQIRDAATAWLMRQAKRIFIERMDHFATQVGVKYTKLRLSSADTRWGSASADGSIRLNWRLVHLPMQSIDYVVVHELSHLRVMDHSPQFWGVVGAVMPDYAERRKALKQSTALGHNG